MSTRNPKLRFEMTEEDGAHYQTAVETDAAGEVTRRKERIDLVVGSGKIFEGYFYWKDDALRLLPVGYFAATGSWANCPGFRDGEANFDRAIEPRCLDCHGTWFEHVPGSENRYRRDHVIPGISCERCHGPGSAHVEWHREHPDVETPVHIVRPAELTRRQRIDLCAQCHGDPGTLLKPAFSYRPGDPLEDYVRQDTSRGPDSFVHTANQVQRLEASACFEKSGTLGCLTCHVTHVDETGVLPGTSVRRCLECHEASSCGARASLPETVRDDCLACHMPEHTVADTTFSTTDADFLDLLVMAEHRIAVHPRATKRRLMEHFLAQPDDTRRARGAGLRKELQAEIEADGRRLLRERRFVESLARFREASRLDGGDAAARDGVARALAAQERATKAEAFVRAAVRALEEGRLEEAQAQLTQGVAIDGEHPDVHYNLGVLFLAQGHPEWARRHLERALAVRDDHAGSHNNLGTALAREHRVQEAAAAFRRATELDERHPEAWFNLAHALAALRQPRAAVAAATRHVELRPDHVEGRLLLARLLADGGDYNEALAQVDLASGLDLQGPEPHRLKGRLLVAAGRPSEAVAAFEESLSRAPEEIDTLNQLAAVLATLNRFDDAERYWLRSLTIQPRQDRVHEALGRLYLGAGKQDEARHHLREALRLAEAAGDEARARELRRLLES